jgi:hypothetical protein
MSLEFTQKKSLLSLKMAILNSYFLHTYYTINKLKNKTKKNIGISTILVILKPF